LKIIKKSIVFYEFLRELKANGEGKICWSRREEKVAERQIKCQNVNKDIFYLYKEFEIHLEE